MSFFLQKTDQEILKGPNCFFYPLLWSSMMRSYDHQYVIGFGFKESVFFTTFFIILDPKQISGDHNIQSHYHLNRVVIELLKYGFCRKLLLYD